MTAWCPPKQRAWRAHRRGQGVRRSRSHGWRGCRLFDIHAELARLAGDTLEDVVDERDSDRHALLAHASVRVDLLGHAVDVDRVAVGPRLRAPPVSR